MYWDRHGQECSGNLRVKESLDVVYYIYSSLPKQMDRWNRSNFNLQYSRIIAMSIISIG